MTKTFPMHAILTMRTGICMGDFGKAHELAEWVLGHPVWTHELASKQAVKAIKDALGKQFPDLPDSLPDVTKENYATVLAELVAKHGTSRQVAKGSEERTQSPIDTMVEMVGAERVLAVAV